LPLYEPPFSLPRPHTHTHTHDHMQMCTITPASPHFTSPHLRATHLTSHDSRHITHCSFVSLFTNLTVTTMAKSLWKSLLQSSSTTSSSHQPTPLLCVHLRFATVIVCRSSFFLFLLHCSSTTSSSRLPTLCVHLNSLKPLNTDAAFACLFVCLFVYLYLQHSSHVTSFVARVTFTFLLFELVLSILYSPD